MNGIPAGTQLRPTFTDPDEATRVGRVAKASPRRPGEGAMSYIDRLAREAGLVGELDRETGCEG